MVPWPSWTGEATIGAGANAAWYFAVLMEDPVIEKDEGSLSGRATFFCIRVISHQRLRCKDRSAGCKEYSWRVRRRFSEFQELDASIRAATTTGTSVALPRKTLLRHLCPTTEFVKQRAENLHKFLTAALDGAGHVVTDEPGKAGGAAEASSALLKFLGMEDSTCSNSKRGFHPGEPRGLCSWAPPANAEERQVALVHSLDRGIYIWAGQDEGSRFQRFDRKAQFGDLAATHAEVRHPRGHQLRRPPQVQWREEHHPGAAGGAVEGATQRAAGSTSSPLLAPSSPVWANSPPPSVSSSPAALLLPLPLASPAQSRCPSPRVRRLSASPSDECLSFSSISTADSEPPSRFELVQNKISVTAVWLEVDLCAEWQRMQDHQRWWAGVMLQRNAQAKASCAEGVRAAGAATPRQKDAPEDRISYEAYLERTAAIYRELSALHEDLHTVLGYGSDGNTLVLVQEAAPGCSGLRTMPFSQQRCYRILAHALKALNRLHCQQVSHGHLSPESFLVTEGPLGPQVRIAWTPGQRRCEGHASANLGFRGPGSFPDAAGDIWALACVILVWWAGFEPVPHPWTQFARSARIQQDIHAALAQRPPVLPKALLDVHLAAANAEEPAHTFLSLLASLLTRCLSWDPAERPSAAQLLQHRFFEQTL